MKRFLYKLFFGKPEYNYPIRISPYKDYLINLDRIWNNYKHHDIGFEKIVRLLLVSTQIIFPGIHFRTLFWKKGLIYKNVAVEFYVLFKTVLPLILLMNGLYKYKSAVIIVAYLLAETIFYVASLIFVSDMFVKPRSYRRNILMLFFNYLEITLSFAVIYAGLNLLRGSANSITDYIYFSFVTSATIGYGDFHPTINLGKLMVCMHSILVLAFVVLVVNFFGSKVEMIHYEEDK
jgi:hypothetical protein